MLTRICPEPAVRPAGHRHGQFGNRGKTGRSTCSLRAEECLDIHPYLVWQTAKIAPSEARSITVVMSIGVVPEALDGTELIADRIPKSAGT